jgi:hypothetical protein
MLSPWWDSQPARRRGRRRSPGRRVDVDLAVLEPLARRPEPLGPLVDEPLLVDGRHTSLRTRVRENSPGVRGCASLLGGGRVSASDASGWCCWAQAYPTVSPSRPQGPPTSAPVSDGYALVFAPRATRSERWPSRSTVIPSRSIRGGRPDVAAESAGCPGSPRAGSRRSLPATGPPRGGVRPRGRRRRSARAGRSAG